MKYSKSKILFVGVVVVACFLIAGNALAQGPTCSMARWSAKVGTTTDLEISDNPSVGVQGSSNRRYAGPCGMRVKLQGVEAYLTDNSPGDETVFNVRFYFFLNNVESDVLFYQALDGADNVIAAKYDATAEEVDVVFGAAVATLSFDNLSAGWNSLEIKWSSDASATLTAVLGNAAGTVEKTATGINTSALAVDSARLGVSNAIVGSIPSSGSIDFDDYDSRRDTVPGRLVRGDATGDNSVNSLDFVQVINDIGGLSVAPGQPDCTEDGKIDSLDFVCVINVIAGQ